MSFYPVLLAPSGQTGGRRAAAACLATYQAASTAFQWLDGCAGSAAARSNMEAMLDRMKALMDLSNAMGRALHAIKMRALLLLQTMSLSLLSSSSPRRGLHSIYHVYTVDITLPALRGAESIVECTEFLFLRRLCDENLHQGEWQVRLIRIHNSRHCQ